MFAKTGDSGRGTFVGVLPEIRRRPVPESLSPIPVTSTHPATATVRPWRMEIAAICLLASRPNDET